MNEMTFEESRDRLQAIWLLTQQIRDLEARRRSAMVQFDIDADRTWRVDLSKAMAVPPTTLYRWLREAGRPIREQRKKWSPSS